MLDHVVSQRLREPTPWEWRQYQASRGQSRHDWTDLLDRARDYLWDDSTLQCVDSEARRQDVTRKQWWAMPAPACAAGGPRPNVFRCLFLDGGTSATRDSWFDADRYTPVSTKVGDFVDYIDAAHTLTQGSDALRVLLPAADPDFGNAMSAQFVRAAANRYASGRLAADWRYWHDGSGLELFIVGTPKQSSGTGVWATTRNTGTGGTVYRGSSGSHGWYVGNSATPVINQLVGTGLTLNTPTYVNHSYATSQSPDFAINRRATSVATGNQLSAPASGDPERSLQIGSDAPASTSSETLAWRALYTFRRVLTTAQRAVVQQYIQRDTGLVP